MLWQIRFLIVSSALTGAVALAMPSFGLMCKLKSHGPLDESKFLSKSGNMQEGNLPVDAGTTAMTYNAMSKQEVNRLLKEGKEKGYIVQDLPNNGADVDASAQTIERNQIDFSHDEPHTRTETGRQQLLLRLQPSGRWNESTDRRLPLFFDGTEWTGLFHDALRVQVGEPFEPGEELDEFNFRKKTKFQESLPSYPMLGRIWDTYIDVNYEPQEIYRLRDECLLVKASTSQPVALRGLEKLIAACDEAIELGLGLQMSSE
jgi:hypothetical protein